MMKSLLVVVALLACLSQALPFREQIALANSLEVGRI